METQEKKRKYELTKEKLIWEGRTLRRIRALISFCSVNAGDTGGWIESESNLSQEDNAWVFGNAKAFDNACVLENARVSGFAIVSENARAFGNACVLDIAHVSGCAIVSENARVDGGAHVFSVARVGGHAHVGGSASISTPEHVLTIEPIGSRRDTITFFRGTDIKINVCCGCFSGTLDGFLQAVQETHGDNKYAEVYRLAAELAKAQIELE